MKKYFLALSFFIFFASPVLAVTDCPLGRVDSSVASCGLYEDSNKDGICDNSQEDLKEGLILNEVNDNQEAKTETERKSYRLLLLTIVMLAIYALTFFLYKKEKIKFITHKKIWNVVLLISFLLCGLSGILLIIRIDYGINFTLFPNLLYGHVETGIIFAVVCLMHIIERRSYFKNIFK